jgi:anti-sigma regulatory factor (Ser/Thr protein kinase)
MTCDLGDAYGTSSTAAEQRITVRNSYTEIAAVTDALEAFARAQSLPDTLIWRFHLALEELLRNVIAHAYPDSAEHHIDVTIEYDGTYLTATVADDGIPFNPLNTAPPSLSGALDEREIGGVGIHLARNIVDTLGYEWQAGRNVVTVRSRL